MLALLDDLDNDDIDDRKKPLIVDDVVSTAIHGIAEDENSEISVPSTFNKAVNDPVYGNIWKEAIDEEIMSLLNNNTRKEEVAPSGTNLVDTKWVFSVKNRPDGSFDSLKAREGSKLLWSEDLFPDCNPGDAFS
ncbi:hypothetical protein OnM2_090041 [Erysiphe neolycopersici]|uniref:Reverse transcriptase Ty1/copia-type domain-containing protein n=1 Tax=Erysiphe neolycopersici TaxID=212602 RepID=A0A420HD32_9PEZI|nr:hypothetical protein OnM2_090041 [Erysiphe neolycopersici]